MSGAGIYLVIGALLLGAIAPSFAAPLSQLRLLRFLLVFAVYPLFVAIAATQGLQLAGLLWIALTGVALVLELVADTLLPKADRQSLPSAVWKTALLWPLLMVAAVEALLIHLGLAPKPPEVRLPEPPRGSELFRLSDDDLLVAAYQILAGRPDHSKEERTLWVAETFSREVHGGGFFQWFCNTENSVSDTVEALRTVRAPAAAELLQQATEAVPRTWGETQTLELRSQALKPVEPALRALDATFFSLQRSEDLTSLVARFVRQNRSRCPALGDRAHEGA